MKIIVKNDDYLLEYLYKNISNRSKNNVKTLLKNGVYVNGKLVTKHDYMLKIGDELNIIINRIDSIDVIYEDNDFLVVNKPYNLLTVSTEKEKEKTLYHMVLEYLRKKNQRVFIVHRLDKDTSGLVVFCKNAHLRDLMQKNWGKVIRKYVAVVEGDLKDLSGSFKSYLIEDNNFKVHVTNSKNGKLAITNYKKLKSNFRYTLVEIEILTGRKNQIRVQFSQNGNPVVGDKKYSSRKSGGRLYLHSNRLEFVHPITKKKMNFTLPIPVEFDTMVK